MLGDAFGGVNWIAVALGAVFSMILGTLWYGPLFGNLWMSLIDRKREELKSSPVMYIFTLIAAFVSAMILAVIIAGFGVTTWWMGIVMGAIVWVGIGATAMLTTSIFNETKMGVWLLFALYQLIVFAVEGLVFAIW